MATLTNNGICRCCASEGTFKDVRSVYVWMGEEEIYADMLKECFDITLSAQEGLSGVCEVCVTQLRNARNFKRQVLDIEDRFRRHLFDDLLNRECTPAPHSLLVKMEVQAEGHSESEPDDVDDEDYTPEFKEVPVIKREASEEPKAKRRAKTTPKKKEGIPRARSNVVSKSQDEIAKVTAENTKMVSRDPHPKISGRTLLRKHLQNIRAVLMNSNATPMKVPNSNTYVCCYCLHTTTNPIELKEHTLKTHGMAEKKVFMQGVRISDYIVKLDITGLQCDMCETDFSNLDDFIDHLIFLHGLKYYRDINSHILPFIFDEPDIFKCVICENTYDKFSVLLVHMSCHFRNYVCEICDVAFVNKCGLSSHKGRHKQGDFPCSVCPKIFDTGKKKRSHEALVHSGDGKRIKCTSCPEKFINYAAKVKHMINAHGVEKSVYRCKACERTFNCHENLRRHTRKYHLLERQFVCDECDKGFFNKRDLAVHMVKHTGERQYVCKLCHKAYGRINTLKQHMRIHLNDRRYKCLSCSQGFVQRNALKVHMRSMHGQSI